MSIDRRISDLFLRSHHEYKWDGNPPPWREPLTDAFIHIHTEAQQFLDSLKGICAVPLPTVEELVQDFFERL